MVELLTIVLSNRFVCSVLLGIFHRSIFQRTKDGELIYLPVF